MAQRLEVVLLDDLDESQEAERSVPFAFDGVEYEIDLSAAHIEQLHLALQPYMEAARRTGRTASRVRKRAAKGAGGRDYDPDEVRTWAKGRGRDVAARGRIPADILKEYRDEQQGGRG